MKGFRNPHRLKHFITFVFLVGWNVLTLLSGMGI